MPICPAAFTYTDVMSESVIQPIHPFDSGGQIIPLSAINQYLYCPRRAALIHVEGTFTDNEHTLIGSQFHEQADVPGYEKEAGTEVLRALPVWSQRLGLSGKCDIVEVKLKSHSKRKKSRFSPGNINIIYPVEYKKGKRRKFDNDDAQLCAQALCLEEMFEPYIPRGAIFHVKSKRRREVEFTEDLRRLTEQAIEAMHRQIEEEAVPQAVHKPQCSECSLFDHCLPEITSVPPTLARAYRAVFDTTD